VWVPQEKGKLMTFGQAIANGFKNYVTWKGRATRAEYWWWTLFIFIVTLPFSIIYNVSSQAGLEAALAAGDQAAYLAALFGPAYWLLVVVSLVFLLPSLAVTIRRLHDIDRSGGWFWIILVPVAGSIVLLVFALLPSTPGKNRFDS
jgi:uncharacterized membrane protein YhaH (DUF805 family)